MWLGRHVRILMIHSWNTETKDDCYLLQYITYAIFGWFIHSFTTFCGQRKSRATVRRLGMVTCCWYFGFWNVRHLLLTDSWLRPFLLLLLPAGGAVFHGVSCLTVLLQSAWPLPHWCLLSCKFPTLASFHPSQLFNFVNFVARELVRRATCLTYHSMKKFV